MEDKGKTFFPISLGCPKNLTDSEHLLGRLTVKGWRATDAPEQAELIIVNTCAFIQSAVEESIDVILETARAKKDGAMLVVMGCLPERYKEDLAASLPEVDLFWGSGGLDLLPDRIEALGRGESPGPLPWPKPGFASAQAGPRLRSAPFFQAYLKIAEGCSNACSYCLIPQLRGPLKSRPLPVLVDEATALVESGAREIIIVAQDVTAYGRDLRPRRTLPGLLAKLSGIAGLDWLRVMYAYPSGLSDELIELMSGESKVLPYLDIPLQHASPRVLAAMGRRHPDDLPRLLERLKNKIPGLTLRTTMMVGFPGETDEDFQQLLDFVREVEFNRLGVFKFSAEEGSKACLLPARVPQKIKEVRRRKLMALQRKISRRANQALLGKILPVLVHGFSEETDLLLAGRTQGQAPEIDGQVLITKGQASAGDIVRVLITAAHDYDLAGEIVGDGS
ncbi:MAG: 30S ribosomal protein S12 methylthiotransferase RimO [Pseudomonadota bacterium]